MLGRVIAPNGEPIDGKGPIKGDVVNAAEEHRELYFVNLWMLLQTGLKSIDMIPIGRGQRELIIGVTDRKTSIAIDTILNQEKNFEAGDLCIVYMWR